MRASVSTFFAKIAFLFVVGLSSTCTASASPNVVIFVHGLCGDSETWRNTETDRSWPEMLDSDAFDVSYPSRIGLRSLRLDTGFDIVNVDYSDGMGSDINADALAELLHQKLNNRDLFRRYDRIWSITHSLGGVLAKRLILNLSQSSPAALDKVVGVFLIATPSLGAAKAEQSWLMTFTPEEILDAFFCSNQQVVEDLRPAAVSAWLSRLSRDWARFRHDRGGSVPLGIPYVHCAYELLPTSPFNKVIVGLESAKDGCDLELTGWPRDHRQIVKPSDTNDDVYVWVRSAIRDDLTKLSRERVVRTSAPISLADVIENYSQKHRSGLTDAAGVPFAQATVLFNRDELEGEDLLVVGNPEFGGEVIGSDWQDYFAGLPSDNSCVIVDLSEDRRSVQIDVNAARTKSCGESGKRVCEERACP